MTATLALALAFVSAPPTAPALLNEPIIVEGRDVRERASDYVDKVLPTTFAGQFGRFEQGLCPKAIGVNDALGKEITDRIRKVAKAANMDVADSPCTPNLIIITAANKKGMISALRKSRPLYVKGVGVDALNQLADAPRPFMSWQVTDVVGADGMPVSGAGESKATMDVVDGSSSRAGEGTNRYEGQFARVNTTVSASRLRSAVKPRVLAAIVIVETKALSNVSTRQLADFALVRAMVPTVVHEGEAPASSILNLFDVPLANGPQSVTWFDLGFLRAMANTRSDAFANIQRNTIQHQMVKEVEKAPIAER